MDLHREFGGHIRALRQARGLTQASLAKRSQVSADAIRRLEAGDSSPSLETLDRLARGLGLQLCTLFGTFESREPDGVAELCDYLETRTPREVRWAYCVLLALFGRAGSPELRHA
jgi:transcriptional regulator with XRE-family HTH domain